MDAAFHAMIIPGQARRVGELVQARAVDIDFIDSGAGVGAVFIAENDLAGIERDIRMGVNPRAQRAGRGFVDQRADFPIAARGRGIFQDIQSAAAPTRPFVEGVVDVDALVGMALGEKQRRVKQGHHGFFQSDFLIRFGGTDPQIQPALQCFVFDHRKIHTAVGAGGVIEADPGFETRVFFIHFVGNDAVGMGEDSMTECPRSGFQRLPVWPLVIGEFAPANGLGRRLKLG